MAGCAGKPLVPFSIDPPPLVLLPAEQAGIADSRGRFREIACAVLESHGRELPNYRPCDEVLQRVGQERGATGEPVELTRSDSNLTAAFVPGVGWECIANWMSYEDEFAAHVDRFGYGSQVLAVDGLSGTATNARQIRDAILDDRYGFQRRELVLIGYSKGAPDILEAIVRYPEIREFVAAVVSVAGAIGGSPLANDVSQSELNLLRHIPDSDCSEGDGKAVESLRPAERRAWLADNPLPPEIPYYSVVTYPDPEQISTVLKTTYNRLARIDPRNDSQVIFYDQVIPGSTLVAYLNADHWAIAVPIAESHPFIGRNFVDRNRYPRQALAEALLRFIEEDLERRSTTGSQ